MCHIQYRMLGVSELLIPGDKRARCYKNSRFSLGEVGRITQWKEEKVLPRPIRVTLHSL
jgi:hypothetical protein